MSASSSRVPIKSDSSVGAGRHGKRMGEGGTPRPSSADVPPWWSMQRGDDCLVATAIHNGSDLRPEVEEAMALSAAERLREEDPHTGQAIVDLPNHVVVHRSRFEVDLNRAEALAVYRETAQSWGMKVWRESPDAALVTRSLHMHRQFYSMLGQLTDALAETCGRFAVLDVHSYNVRRNGAQAPPTPGELAPDVNIGTWSMPRDYWAFLIDPLIEGMRQLDFGGRRLDVRENIAFEGRGELTRFVHARHPHVGCAIAIEFRKFFMDEWSGVADSQALLDLRGFVRDTAALCRTLLHV
jgi:hypothetical protein